jgi:hypothetical protein
MQTIPITAGVPSQNFRITLNGTSYHMTARWNSRASFWTLDIADENETTVISGLALRSGVDLLEPFTFGIGQLYMYDATETSTEATLSNISSDVFLIYLTPDEDVSEL